MRRLALGCAVLALTANLAGCGDDDDVKPDVDAALPDASTEPDASAALLGNWHVVELDFRDDGGTRQTVRPTETVQTNDAGVVINRGRISGTFSLDPEVWSLGQAIVLNGRTIVPGGMTNVQVTWTASDTQFMLPLNNVVDYMLQGVRLIMNTGGVTLRFERYTPANVNTMTLAGTAELPLMFGTTPLTPLTKPRVALAFLLRHLEGRADDFIVPPNTAGDTNDRALGDGSQWNPGDANRTFDLSRSAPPLGVERIDYGNAATSVGVIVLYDDKNGNSKLDNFAVAGADEIRGSSQVLLTYRLLDDPELRLSRLRFLPSGWSQSVLSLWFTSAGVGNGLVPLDNTAAAIPVDVTAVTPTAGVNGLPVSGSFSF